MRQSVLGNLVEVAAGNVRHGRDDVAIFEIGKGYGRLEGERTHEWWRLGFVLVGSATIEAWDQPARPYDLDDAKGLIELVAHRLGFPSVAYERLADDPILHPGRAAVATAGTSLRGRVGELHPSLVEELDLRGGRPVVAELAIAGLSGGQPSVPRGATPSRHPAVERDLAVVVEADVPAATVQAAIARHGGTLLISTSLFDIYRGRPLTETQKSLAYRIVFQAPDRTLTEDEIDAAVAGITHGLATDVDGRIRT
jgi:phenylalanyl-tRNA synthetase beta chain